MDFDKFAELNTMGHLAGALQRSQQNALLREQKDLERATQQQNAKIIRLLEEQKAREDAEKRRLESLPRCPDCKSPVEFGVRRCKHCRIEIITWDYAGEGLPWRLICRKQEAADFLKARRDSLVSLARQLQRVCIETCRECDLSWLSRIQGNAEELGGMIERQKTNKSRTALRESVNAYLSGKPVLTPKDRAFLDGWINEIKQTYSDQEKLDLNSSVSEAKNALSRADASCESIWGSFSVGNIGCAIPIAWLVTLFSLVPIGLVEVISGREVFKHETLMNAVLLMVGFAAFVVLSVIYPLRCTLRRNSARKAVSTAEAERSRFNVRERTALDALNEKVQTLSDQNKEKLSQCGALALADAIDAADDSLTSRWSNLQNLCGDLRRYYKAAEAVEAFARSIGLDLPAMATAIEFNCPNCASTVRVSDKATGKIGRCPNCDERVRIPKCRRGPLKQLRLVDEVHSAAARSASVLHGTELDSRMTTIADGVHQMQLLLASLKKIDV